MNVLTIVSPGLKVLFERVGKPEVINRPEVLRLSGTAAVIACNHIGWVDSLWVAYAVYPRQLRYMSKQELFNSRVAKWILEQGGSFAVAACSSSRPSRPAASHVTRQPHLSWPTGSIRSSTAQPHQKTGRRVRRLYILLTRPKGP
jgi:1-acyl-sn-glycerol-3-phosphate acyltransferase